MFFATAKRAFISMAAPTTTAPYTRAVVSAMRKLYPEALADKSFDNTGCIAFAWLRLYSLSDSAQYYSKPHSILSDVR